MLCHICRLLVLRWYVEEYFKAHSIDYKKTIGNIALGGLGAYEETLGMDHVCQLELGVGQARHNRENTEALDKANGSVAWHRAGVWRGHGIQNCHGASKWDGLQVEGGIEE